MPAWQLRWFVGAEAALRSIPWREAARIDAALIRLAAIGEGELERLPNDPTGAWLRVGAYRARLILERQERIISVMYVWRI
jgi:hypothetical protein